MLPLPNSKTNKNTGQNWSTYSFTITEKKFEQSFRGVFKQIEHVVEIFACAVIGVGHARLAFVVAEEVGHQYHLLHVGGRRGHVAQAPHIVGIHGNDVVEMAEVFRRHGTRTMGQFVAALGGLLPHSAVGKFAFVVVDEACRIDFKLRVERVLLDPCAEHLFGGDRAADVSQANEKNFGF